MNLSENLLTITGTTTNPFVTNPLTIDTDYRITFVNSANSIVPTPVVGGFTIYRFSSLNNTITGTYTSPKSLSVSYLVVGGGASGVTAFQNFVPGVGWTWTNGGGGAAGSVLEGTLTAVGGGVYSFSVGRGGEPSMASGTNSSLQGNSIMVTSPGGSTWGINSTTQAGRGNGASQIGELGGAGITSTTSGSSIVYGGGGGGGSTIGIGANTTGGAGGGGNGGFNTQPQGSNGTDGLGGGGGGGSFQGGVGNSAGRGGSGVVILRIPSYT
jgi:hypothetical protein